MGHPVVAHPDYSVPLPAGHRFPMPKYLALRDALLAEGLLDPARQATPVPCPPGWLGLAHAPGWIDRVLAAAVPPAQERVLGFKVTPSLARRARLATGGTLLAARLALEHGLALNLAGGSHHAQADHGAGFCIFNDVAVATRVLLAEGAVRRVLILDLDVHQGDGTAAILAADPGALTVSVHCRTNYPARKQQSGIDVALDPGADDGAYLALLEVLLPAVLARGPFDLAFYNAGVDPHAQDRLGRLALSDAGLFARERLVLGALRAAGLPVVVVPGGGYDDDPVVVARRHLLAHRAAAELG